MAMPYQLITDTFVVARTFVVAPMFGPELSLVRWPSASRSSQIIGWNGACLAFLSQHSNTQVSSRLLACLMLIPVVEVSQFLRAIEEAI